LVFSILEAAFTWSDTHLIPREADVMLRNDAYYNYGSLMPFTSN
jgi:hypothetical protein